MHHTHTSATVSLLPVLKPQVCFNHLLNTSLPTYFSLLQPLHWRNFRQSEELRTLAADPLSALQKKMESAQVPSGVCKTTKSWNCWCLPIHWFVFSPSQCLPQQGLSQTAQLAVPHNCGHAHSQLITGPLRYDCTVSRSVPQFPGMCGRTAPQSSPH